MTMQLLATYVLHDFKIVYYFTFYGRYVYFH